MGDIKGPVPETDSSAVYASGGPVGAVAQSFRLGEGPLAMGGCIGGYIDPQVVAMGIGMDFPSLLSPNPAPATVGGLIYPDIVKDGQPMRIPEEWGKGTGSITTEMVAAAGPDVGEALAMQGIAMAPREAAPLTEAQLHGQQPLSDGMVGDTPAPQLGQIVVEVDLGPDDVLVLQCNHYLTDQQRMRMEKDTDTILAGGVRRTLILDGGMEAMVLHRTAPAEDSSKPRKDRPYLEDMGRAGAAEAPRGTSEGSEP